MKGGAETQEAIRFTMESRSCVPNTRTMTSLDSNTTVSRQPPQKYDGLSKVDADFAPLQAAVDGHLKPLFKLPISQLRAAILAAPQVFPEGTPMPGDHFSLSHERVQVRDGAMVEVRIYKPTGACNNAPLVLVAHGGGQIFRGIFDPASVDWAF